MSKEVGVVGSGKKKLLPEIVSDFLQKKSELDGLKPIVDSLNKTIKSMMAAAGINVFVSGDKKVTITENKSTSFSDGPLMEWLKANPKTKKIVKKREYIDMEALEDAMYKGVINAADLVPFQNTSTTVVLRVAKADPDTLEGLGQ